ncbi:MAG: ATP-binding protein [Candidatus Micrarchaeota archaeon]|nr:ATP-binding protein [Candidatus Micrarchaeota archaeon]
MATQNSQSELGTVISTMEGPTTIVFSFVIGSSKVRKGQFVKVKSDSGFVLGSISEITRANRYFERAESVAEYERTSPMTESFPVTDWEYVVANVRVHGVFESEGTNSIVRNTFPVAPGAKVLACEDELLKKFLQLDDNGLNIGKLQHHSLEAKLSMGKLLQKHLAVLAMSGSGKSYFMSVLIEEMLERKSEHGRMAVVVIDSHGEYSGFRATQYGKQTEVVDAKKFRIAFRKVSPQMLAEWMPEMSATQFRELVPIMEALRKERKEKHESYSLEDLMDRIEAEMADKKKDNVKRPLLAWLSALRSMRIFGPVDYPKLEESVTPGKLVVLDLSDVDNMKKKQMLVSYLCRRLFKLRKKEKVAPFVLVLEEAHNFAPEKAERQHALAKGPVVTIAREGRKFGACLCLISQRPVQLATTALAQCNTNIILRITNPFDIKHIGESCEGIDSSMLDSITTLRVGEALVVGEAVGSPIFVKIRRRKAEFSAKGKDLELIAKRFEEEKTKKKQDVEAFL